MKRIVLNNGIDFSQLPKPKYKIGDNVYYFEYNVSSVIIKEIGISEVYYDINYFNNDYREAFDYKISYMLTNSYRELIKEDDLYSTKELAIEAYNIWKVEELKKTKKLLTKNIEDAENTIIRYKQRLNELI